jgi:hypothetical protein
MPKTQTRTTTKSTARAKRKPASAAPTPFHHTVVHHTKRAYHLTPKFVHGMVAGAFIGIMVVTGLRLTDTVGALSIVSARDCDSNAVINCGALTTKELQDDYDSKGVPAIYSYFGISSTDIKNINSTAVAGQVHKNGTIVVNGATVATGAITAGRENIAGSTKVSSGGITFYKRSPSVSFRVESLSAFVVMKDGQFAFAILGACGNPVMATPVPKKTPVKPPTTPVKTTPTPTPKPTPVKEETPTTTPSVTTTTSTQTPPSTPVVQTSVAELPKTGPGSAITIGLLAIVGGYIFHITHRRVKRRRQHNATF